jgi:hypothetical protein
LTSRRRALAGAQRREVGRFRVAHALKAPASELAERDAGREGVENRHLRRPRQDDRLDEDAEELVAARVDLVAAGALCADEADRASAARTCGGSLIGRRRTPFASMYANALSGSFALALRRAMR